MASPIQQLNALRLRQQQLQQRIQKRTRGGDQVVEQDPQELMEKMKAQLQTKKVLYQTLFTIDTPLEVSDLEDLVNKERAEPLDKAELQENLQELEHKHRVLHIDHLTLSAEKECLVIGKLDKAKLKVLYDMLFGKWTPSELGPPKKKQKIDDDMDVDKWIKKESLEQILNKPSTVEQQNQKKHNELDQILDKQSWRETQLVQTFKSKDKKSFRHFCQYMTKEDCKRSHNRNVACGQIHYIRIIESHTDTALGNCNFLDTCLHMKTCKFVHYKEDLSDNVGALTIPKSSSQLLEPQWINCDVRKFDWSKLGKFSIVMADPPWRIHMEIPYGHMNDEEIKQMNLGVLSDDGYMFLWATTRALELARECLATWGYERVDELVWIKTNQLQRIIRTGRTGHWLNHSKEHCLIGKKGNPSVNKHIDCDVIVAEVREKSRKPDEIYGIAERLSPGTRKIEVFGRKHNRTPGWITLGNQLPGVHIVDPLLDPVLIRKEAELHKVTHS